VRYEISLTYSEPLIRYAVLRFWWRVIGLRFVLAVAWLSVSLIVLLWGGNTSWRVGILGGVLAMAFVFAAALYGVHYHNSLAKLRAMGHPCANLVLTDAALSFTSGAGSSTVPWSAVKQVWQFPQCWLLLFSQAQFVTLPLASVAPDAREFILERVRSR
jgi:hypothetical protein